jgi:hypothetical protein
MQDIQINNIEILKELNSYSDFIMDKWNSKSLQKDLHLTSINDKAEDFVSVEYLENLIKKGHAGFPESLKGYSGLMPDHKGELQRISSRGMAYRDTNAALNNTLMAMLSAKRNSLATVYPPGGFISWHHNANAPGYNIIFTWSENGKGWFKYKDPKTKEIVTMHDKVGWNCKMGYFGSYHEPDKIFYHSAYTDCVRISIAYIFSQAENFWKDVIEDIEECH